VFDSHHTDDVQQAGERKEGTASMLDIPTTNDQTNIAIIYGTGRNQPRTLSQLTPVQNKRRTVKVIHQSPMSSPKREEQRLDQKSQKQKT